MALSFPNNPSVGDIYEDSASGFSYQWSGEVWKSYKVSTDSLGGNLDADLTLNSNDITGTGDIDTTGNLKISGIATLGNVIVGGATTALLVEGDSRITGVLTVGSSSIKFDGENNTINVGSALTLGHSQGLQFYSQNLHSTGFEVNNINASGVVTATTFSGNATGLTGSPSITVTDITASGDITVGGTLTYEDVSNVDSVGLVTARTGVRVTAGGLEVSNGGLSVTGVITASNGVTGNLTGDVTGNADTATTLATSRTLSISGDGTGSASFNGSGNADIALTLANSGVTAATYGSSSAIPSITVDAKGRITSATTNSIDSTSISNGSASVSVASNGPIASNANHDFSAGIDVTGNITVSGTVDGRDVATDGSKLDGIEANATADQTASEILTAIKTVDGASSGLDADTLDGLEATSFLRSDITTYFTSGALVFNDNRYASFGSSSDMQIFHDGSKNVINGRFQHPIEIRHDTELYIKCEPDSNVELYYDNSKKLETTNHGAIVTGILTATSLSGDVTGNVSGNAGTATSLATARTIGGVSFDGTSNINLPGVNASGNQNTSGTAAGLSGSPSITVTDITASGNVSIAGTLTYEDVSNVDSVGLVTARTGVRVTAGGIEVSNGGAAITGVTTSTSFVKSGGTSSQFLKADGSVDSSTYITSADGGNADQLDGQEGTYYLNYNNFTNTPTIPTNNNQLTNGAGYITSADGGNAATLDSLDSTQFLRSDAADTASGAISLSVDTTDALNFTANSSNDARGISFNSRTALSADYNDGWLRLNQSSEFSNGIYTPGNFRADGRIYVDNGTNYLSYPTGNYGSIQINAGGAGGWEGFSIDGRSVFMHDGGSSTGIYNDVNNHWMFYGVFGGSTYMYYNGSWKIRTISSGMEVSGSVSASSAAGSWIATQAEAEAGTNNNQIMTPLRVKQAIAALGGGSVIASIQRGTTAFNSNTVNVTISSVNTSKSFISSSSRGNIVRATNVYDSNAPYAASGSGTAALTSSTNVQVVAGGALAAVGYSYLGLANSGTVSWEVIEFT